MNYTFSIFDLWILSGDIRDQSRKLSEIVKKIGRFFWLSQILGGRSSKNCTHVITPGSRHVVWIKICDDIPICPEVIDAHTLNFKQNFKFSRLIFFLGGRTPSQLGCALGSLGQSLAHVKISGHSPPPTPKGENTVSRKVRTTVGQYSRQ